MITVEVHGLKLGGRYRDRATGFSGTAVGVWVRWEGAIQVSLTRVGADGRAFEQWFDGERLEAISIGTTP